MGRRCSVVTYICIVASSASRARGRPTWWGVYSICYTPHFFKGVHPHPQDLRPWRDLMVDYLILCVCVTGAGEAASWPTSASNSRPMSTTTSLTPSRQSSYRIWWRIITASSLMEWITQLLLIWSLRATFRRWTAPSLVLPTSPHVCTLSIAELLFFFVFFRAPSLHNLNS